jgi:hypothetical protein
MCKGVKNSFVVISVVKYTTCKTSFEHVKMASQKRHREDGPAQEIVQFLTKVVNAAAARNKAWCLTVGVLLDDEDSAFLGRYMKGVQENEKHDFPHGTTLAEVFEEAQEKFEQLQWEAPSQLEPLLFPNQLEKDPEVALKLAIAVINKIEGIDTLKALRAERLTTKRSSLPLP